MPTAIILAAGAGSKIWPYAVVRPKPLIPISNRPIIAYLVDQLQFCGFERIRIAAGPHLQQYANFFRDDANIELIPAQSSGGTADTLRQAWEGMEDPWLTVLYGDCLLDKEDLAQLAAEKRTAALVNPHRESSRNYIGCTIEDGRVKTIIGHSRQRTTHHFLGFNLPAEFRAYLSAASNLFPKVEVGMMVPEESFLEAALIDFQADGQVIEAIPTRAPAFDIDKPWHILEANTYNNRRICGALRENVLEEGASIDPSALLAGKVRLGKNSSIGKNVIIEGNIWVGDNTEIKHGAVLKGDNVIGDHCEIGYYCHIEKDSTVGDYSKILRGAELSGMIFKRVYLYHYMEIAGIVGENTDLGAGTVCGSLRFDDGLTPQKVKGRWEYVAPQYLANACYVGDYARTGINAMLLPGVKTGARSVVGPGVILDSDLGDSKIILAKQETIIKDWDHHRYGW
jgi:NDP-sugar pyrophosphorylase family protein